MQASGSGSRRRLTRGLIASLLVLAAVGLGFVLDRLTPLPSWSQPELVGPTPREQFTAQAAVFLESFDVVVRMPLLEELVLLRKLSDRPELMGDDGSAIEADRPPTESPTGPEQSEASESAESTQPPPPPPKIWQPQDIEKFWHDLSPAERQALGVIVAPREGLPLPEGLWPIEQAWNRYRQRPIADRLHLQFRLQKLYWFEPDQRSRLLENYQRLRALPPEDQQALWERLDEFWAMEDAERASVISIFRRFRGQPPAEQERLRGLVR